MLIDDQFVSLLWPTKPPERHEQKHYPSRLTVDLGLKEIIDLLNPNPQLRHHTENLVLLLCDDPRVINYRLDILDDLMSNPYLVAGFKNLLPLIQKLARYKDNKNVKGLHAFQQIAWRLETLVIYTECVQTLHQVLSKPGTQIKSVGLKRLLSYVNELMTGSEFISLIHDIPALIASLNSVSSITIGINLGLDMRPCEAVVLSIGTQPFKKKPLLSQYIKWSASKDDEAYGIGYFHSKLKPKLQISALENMLFHELKEVYEAAINQVATVLTKYARNETRLFLEMEPAIDFYLGAVALIQKFSAIGLPLTRPVIVPKAERRCTIDGLYDINLALSFIKQGRNPAEIVQNSISFGEEGRIFILTGPNQGGKTTFTRAIGVAQVLMQVGIYVPGIKATMSPADGIYTHFLEEEKFNAREGRLGEESQRLSEIFAKATPYSLILLNESLSSTSPGESLYLTEDIVKALRYLGARCIFATHLHELAARAASINMQITGDSKVASLVVSLDSDASSKVPGVNRIRNYRVVIAQPQGESFARDIAEKYGITFTQLLAKMEDKNRSGI